MDDIIVICNHHRRSLFFEESIRILYKAGLQKILIQETGSESFGPYSGPLLRKFKSRPMSWDQGMVSFRSQKLEQFNAKYILLLDSDFFIHDAEHILSLIEETKKGQYDFVSSFIHNTKYKDLDFTSSIVQPVVNQTIVPIPRHPFICPDPQYENFCALYNMEMWKKISIEDFSDGNKTYVSIYNNKGKFGTYSSEHIQSHSQRFNGYFHVGNLISSYYALENGNNDFLISNLSRLGYFFAQERKYGSSIYPREIQKRLFSLISYKDIALKAWDELTEGTCLQTYYR